MLKAIVTGGTGLIGKLLSKRLVELGCQVTIMSRSIPADEGAYAKFVALDIVDKDAVQKAVLEANPDLVVHLAAYTSVIKCEERPKEAFDVNVFGSYNIASAIVRANTGARIIYTSSREVYGEKAQTPVDEHATTNPKNVCGVTKLLGEKAIIMLADNNNFQYIILRMTNVYGPSDQPRGISSMILNAVRGNIVTIHGGDQLINFLYINDAIGSIISAATGKATNDIINIGSNDTITINQFVEHLSSKLNRRFPIRHEKYNDAESRHYIPNIARAKELLGYSPSYPLQKGLDKTIEYFVH